MNKKCNQWKCKYYDEFVDKNCEVQMDNDVTLDDSCLMFSIDEFWTIEG